LGYLCDVTADALRSFQSDKGLPADGICTQTTWQVLVESSWLLGSRLLYLTSPHLRGDDVEHLQSNLAKLGFDCGKADGIFGPLTVRALIDFQFNSGLVPDGICGPKTLRLLERVSGQSGSGPGIVAVREGELLRDPNFETRTHLVVGAFDNTHQIARLMTRRLRESHADVIIADSIDAHQHAMTANSFDARVYVGLTTSSSDTISVSYFETERFVSELGQSLARSLATALSAIVDPRVVTPVGSRLPVLRETKMTAVLVDLGSLDLPAVGARLGETLGNAVAQWLKTPSPPEL
jgi:N-acetylmuramoyl-L-alanine amidase